MIPRLLELKQKEWEALRSEITPADIERFNFHMKCDAYVPAKRITDEFFGSTFDVGVFTNQHVLRTTAFLSRRSPIERFLEFSGTWEIGCYDLRGRVRTYSKRGPAEQHYAGALYVMDFALRAFIMDSYPDFHASL